MTIPSVAPIVVPLPSLGHRKIWTAGLARGHPDSGEAAVMGVPLPHLVLPGLVVGLVCPRHMVDWPQCVCAAVDASLPGFARWRYFVDMWVAEGHTARWRWLCVLFVHRFAVCV